jgi:predicted DNA-binding antitoxin AbrB/MazE fold protein
MNKAKVGSSMTSMTVRAIYENGVLKPLDPLNLPEKQILEVRIEIPAQERRIVRLGGTWSQYVTGGGLPFEEIQSIVHEAEARSLNRLIKQIGGEFDGDSAR